MTTNELNQHSEILPADFETEQLDETILVAMSNENRLKEQLLDLDKFKRKIVHKIAERFGVKREYVNLKPNDFGDITLSKSEETFIPEVSLSEVMRRRELEKGKNSIDQSKRKIFKRNPANQPTGEKNYGNNLRRQDDNANSREEEVEIQRKNEKYEEAKKRILTGKNNHLNAEGANLEKGKINKLESRQNNNKDGNYDPDYNRNLNRPVVQPQPMPMPVFQQPMLQNPMMMPAQNLSYNNNFPGYQANSNNYMKFTGPQMYQSQPYPQNNILNDLNHPSNNMMQPPQNILTQLGYNNFGVYGNPAQQPIKNQMNLGIFPPQQQQQLFSGHQGVMFNPNPNNTQGGFQMSQQGFSDFKKPGASNYPAMMAMMGTSPPTIPQERKKPMAREPEVVFSEENFPTLEQANAKN